ncbi:excinuclease ABC subunit UvrC [candidate division KSB1 bacterium]|nr:excinuclease ABC subunit UvrC [candidate division KSB1 bacterium]
MKVTLQEKLEHLPTQSGVYLFKDKNSTIIYIGKAKILRNRVRSYFQESRDKGPKLQRLVSQVADLEWIVTDSEIEALILEANLVKEYAPRYNVNLKDDKSFPYIRITNEPFPRLFPTRKIIRDGSDYFGPYTDVKSLRDLLKTIKKIFPLRNCNLELTEKNIQAGKFKVCLNYHIYRCLGPCEGHISAAEYTPIVKDVRNFINGRDRQVIQELTRRMQVFAENLEFEKAARLRDQISFIEQLQYKQKVVTPDLGDRDIVALALQDDAACAALFRVRDGKILGKQHFYLSGVAEENSPAVLAFFIKQYYLKTDFLPAEIFLPEEIEEQVEIEAWLQSKFKQSVKLTVPKIGEKARLVSMCAQNAKLQLGELILQKMKAKDYMPQSVKALQRDLGLAKPPVRIEAFDISNIQGTDPVASMVTFLNGQPHKSDYRRFKIQTKATPDDFAMMAEVIQRRYHRLLQANQPFPDLILVDGGKGQLNAALHSLKALGIENQPIVALAKRLDEVFVPNLSDPQNIPRVSAGLHLLQHVRDESHRFAVNFHRQLRKKRTISSQLDQIPGIADKRRQLLLKHFGSVQQIKAASLPALTEVPGLPVKLAQKIYDFFHPPPDPNSDQTAS